MQEQVVTDDETQNFNYSESYFQHLLNGWNRISFPIISKLLDQAFEEVNVESCLDLGCGNGIYFDVLKRYSQDIYGLDVSEESLKLCLKKGYREVKLAEATTLPYPDNYFDMVFTTEVLEHIEDYQTMLEEINRVLKPSGMVFLTTTCYSTSLFLLPYKNNMRSYLREVTSYLQGYLFTSHRNSFVRKWGFDRLGGHYHGFLPNALKRDMNKSGMKILKKQKLHIVPPIPYNLENIAKSARSSEKNHSAFKRSVMIIVSKLSGFLNPVLRFLGLFANNVYILAKKI